MINFILIVLCVAVGMFIARKNIIPKDSYKSINAWLLYVALPALALRYVPEIHWELATILPATSPILVGLGAFLFVSIYAKKAKLDAQTKIALLVTSGLGNTSFFAFPLITAYYGEGSIKYAIVFDQMTFLLFSTVVVTLVLKIVSTQKVTVATILKRVFLFPSFVAALVALLVSPFWDFAFINPFLDKILATLSPLALFSIGLQLKFGEWRSEAKNLVFGLTYKLLLAPLIVFSFLLIFGGTGNFAKVIVFEAAMPAHVTATLLLSQYDLNPRLCNLLVGFGIVAGLFTSAFWYLICSVF